MVLVVLMLVVVVKVMIMIDDGDDCNASDENCAEVQVIVDMQTEIGKSCKKIKTK